MRHYPRFESTASGEEYLTACTSISHQVALVGLHKARRSPGRLVGHTDHAPDGDLSTDVQQRQLSTKVNKFKSEVAGCTEGIRLKWPHRISTLGLQNIRSYGLKKTF